MSSMYICTYGACLHISAISPRLNNVRQNYVRILVDINKNVIHLNVTHNEQFNKLAKYRNSNFHIVM